MNRNLVLIHVSRILDYKPLSKRRGSNIQRYEILEKMSEKYGVTHEEIVRSFGRYLTSLIRLRVQHAVKTQRLGRTRMDDAYEPLSRDYAIRKQKGKHDKFWDNTGFLIGNLRLWKYRNKFFIGYPPNITHPSGTKASLIMMWNEKGTKTLPARPLFFPLVRHISRHIDEYFDRFINLTETAGRILDFRNIKY